MIATSPCWWVGQGTLIDPGPPWTLVPLATHDGGTAATWGASAKL